MKILAINGSPNKNGNSASIVNAILNGAEKKHQIEKLHLYDYNYRNCRDCSNAMEMHAKQYCVFEDDFTKVIIPQLIEADLIIINTPVYMGQMTGKLKTFFDRFYTFIGEGYSIRLIKGKKFVVVTTSGAPTPVFQDVSAYFEKWLADFFKMEKAGMFHVGDLMGQGGIDTKPEILAEAKKFGEEL